MGTKCSASNAEINGILRKKPEIRQMQGNELVKWIRSIRITAVIFLRPYGLTWLLDRISLLEWSWKNRRVHRQPHNFDAEVLIICAHFNQPEWLKDCVDSVIGQTFQNWSLLIVDDASTMDVDQTLETCEQTDPRIRVLRMTENQGAYVARNSAIQHSEGHWTHVTFIDSDDVAEPDWLEHVLEVSQGLDGWVRPLLKRTDRYLNGNKRLYFGHCQSLFSRGLWTQLGGFQDVRIAGDTELLFRAEKMREFEELSESRAKKTSQKCRVHENNASSTKARVRKEWLESRRREISTAQNAEALFVEARTAALIRFHA